MIKQIATPSKHCDEYLWNLGFDDHINSAQSEHIEEASNDGGGEISLCVQKPLLCI